MLFLYSRYVIQFLKSSKTRETIKKRRRTLFQILQLKQNPLVRDQRGRHLLGYEPPREGSQPLAE